MHPLARSRRSLLLIPALFAAVALGPSASAQEMFAATMATPSVIGATNTEHGITRISDADRAFLSQAYAIHRAQITLGTLACQRGATKPLRSHGTNVVEGQRAAHAALVKVAAMKNIEVDLLPSADVDAIGRELRQAGDDSFERQFFARMVDSHRDAIALYERAAAESTDSDIRALADDMLPVLRTQLADAAQFKSRLSEFAAAP